MLHGRARESPGGVTRRAPVFRFRTLRLPRDLNQRLARCSLVAMPQDISDGFLQQSQRQERRAAG